MLYKRKFLAEKWKALFLIIMIMFFAARNFAQNKFHNLTLSHGLPSNRVNDCLKDSIGFVWFVTDNGVCRYDGARIKVYNNRYMKNYGFTKNNFTKIFQNTKDELLFISFEGTLFSYKYSTGKFSEISKVIPLLKGKILSCVYKDKKNNIWIGYDNGLIKTDDKFTFIKEYPIHSEINQFNVSNKISTIHQDKLGNLWLGMFSSTMLRFDPQKEIYINSIETNFLPGQRQVNDIINSSDSTSIFVIVSGEGLYQINIFNYTYKVWKSSEKNSNSLPSDKMTCMFLQSDSLLWIGSIEGLANINLKTNIIKRYFNRPDDPFSLASNIIHNLYFDSQKILWVSTFGGISRLFTSKERFTKVSQNSRTSNSLSSNIVNHCIKDKFGNLWLATSKGIDIKKANTNFYYHYNLPKSYPLHRNEEIVKFFIDGYTWWIGTWGGGISKFTIPKSFEPGNSLSFVNYFFQQNNNRSISSNFIRSFAKDIEGNLWITTWNGGLNKIKENEKNKININFERFSANENKNKSIASNFIDNIQFDNYNNMWLATSHGLQCVDMNENIYKMVNVVPRKFDAHLNKTANILKDNSGKIWLGTFGGLVELIQTNKYDYSFKVIYDDIEKGIFSLTRDNKGNLWFSTIHSEIGFYDTSTGKLEFYSMIQEVNGFDFYFGEPTIDNQGKIYFTGKSGYLYFNPDQIQLNNDIPKIFISSINVNGEELNTGVDVSLIRNLELDYDQKNITVSFAALNYINAENNEYKYLLEGYQNDWKSVGHRTEIEFVNLPSGKYQLKIIGSNNDGLWNDEGTVLSISISPPLWENNFFRVGILTVILFFVYLYINSKMNRLKKEKQKQFLFSKQLIESQEEERKRVSKELHDGLGQNLLVIKNRIDMLMSSLQNEKSELNTISEFVKESISEVKEISSNLHPHLLESLGLVKAIQSIVKKISNSSNIVIESKIDQINDIFPPDVEINIYRIIQEALNNIVKHSQAKRAVIDIKKMEQHVIITIEDFGKGFVLDNNLKSEENIEGFGLKNMKERVNLIKGKLEVESLRDFGTKITITINLA